MRKPMHLIMQEDTGFYHCNIKTLNLMPSVMAKQKAAEAGDNEKMSPASCFFVDGMRCVQYNENKSREYIFTRSRDQLKQLKDHQAES